MSARDDDAFRPVTGGPRAPEDGAPAGMPVADPGPVIPSHRILPEITLKAVLLAILLSVLLGAANAYLGLFAGMTVSASIPAAVVSMAVLRMFRRANILENNIVQTAASAGEALAAGVIFTIPALLLINYWTAFEYWHTTVIALVGGLIGVLFTIPLRRALIIEARLRFPEGVATAEVLKVGSAERAAGEGGAGRGSTEAVKCSHEAATAGFRALVGAAAVGGLAKMGGSAMRLWAETAEGAMLLGSGVVYIGLTLSPALIAVGFIIGVNIALVVFLGGAVGWFILMPAYGLIYGLPDGGVPDGLTGVAAAKVVWSTKIRYVGIGAMLVGGLWTVGQLRRPVGDSLRTLLAAYRRTSPDAATRFPALPRTERDAPLPWILGPLVILLIPMAVIYVGVVQGVLVGLVMTGVMALAAFLFSAVAAYMSGLVGSSSNPVSGVTIATLMLASLLLVLLLGQGSPAGPAASLLIGAVVACAAAMGGDNLQDLKTGHLVGATPWKQQIMQAIGVAAAAVVLAPVLGLLEAKYGIGPVTPEHPQSLSAPQATLMAGIAQGVFGGSLPWALVGMGALIAIAAIVADQALARRGATFRLPVLAVALGMYLPLTLTTAIMLGGLLALAAQRAAGSKADPTGTGLLFAAGLVTGEALMGILLAVPVALTTVWPALGSDPLALFETPPLGFWPGLAVLSALAWLLYRQARRE